MADEQAALLAQIKALSGAIDERKASSRGGYQHYNNFHQASHRGGGGGSSYSRGRGRGQDAGSSSAANSRHRSLVISGPRATEGSTPVDNAAATTANTEAAGSGEEGWVKRKSTHNMSLVSSSAFKKT